ncbi:MAG: sulfotransferase domain-containing protein [Thermoplasmatota archaeon]
MELDPSTNYIVSGIERSGTSMLMQMLSNGGIPVTFDEQRKPDENNPKGYYELAGGKIINQLMNNNFPFNEYQAMFIKITAYGLKFLPEGNYKIIYSERNINEILDSMEKMAEITDENREETKEIFLKLNQMIKQKINERSDCDVLFTNYNDILKNPETEIKKIPSFLQTTDADIAAMIETIDKKLYRQRHSSKTA